MTARKNNTNAYVSYFKLVRLKYVDLCKLLTEYKNLLLNASPFTSLG